jgi:hypothetical protein
MPDDWELAHSLNPNNNADAETDADNDGISNPKEYIAGTDPQDSKSSLRLTVELLPNSALAIRFVAQPGKTYSIIWNRLSIGGPWQKLKDFGPFLETTSAECIIDAKLSTEPEFYQVVTPKLF